MNPDEGDGDGAAGKVTRVEKRDWEYERTQTAPVPLRWDVAEPRDAAVQAGDPALGTHAQADIRPPPAATSSNRRRATFVEDYYGSEEGDDVSPSSAYSYQVSSLDGVRITVPEVAWLSIFD
jgi:hypothetical protein